MRRSAPLAFHPRIGILAAATLLSVALAFLSFIPPSAAQSPDPVTAAEAQRLENAAVAARQKAAALLNNAKSWEENLIKNNREKAANASDAKTRATYEELAKKQEDGVRKMREDAAALTHSAESDAAQAARIRRGEPVEAAAPARPVAGSTAPVHPNSTTSQTTPPGAGGPPSRIRETTPPSRQVQDYLMVAKKDAERVRQYLEAVEAELTSYGSRIDELNAQADRLVNKPVAQLLKTYPKMSGAQMNIGHGLGWSISENEKEYWVAEIPSGGVRRALKRVDDALHTASDRPIVPLSNEIAERTESIQLRNIDELERSLAEGLTLAFNNRLSMRQQQLRWDVALLDAQATLRTVKGWARWDELMAPIDKDLNAARRAAEDAGTFNQLEPKLFADAMARYAPLCSDLAKQDALYVAEMGGRIQALVDRFKEDHRRTVAEFRAVVTEVYKDKSGIKAELSSATLRQLQDIITDKSFGLRPGYLRVQIVWQVYNYDFGQWVDSLNGPAATADYQTKLNTPSCLTWNDQMPVDLESRFPALTVEFQDHRAFLSVNFDKPQKAANAHIAQGGRYPDDGL